jgi:MFS family permease
VDQHQVGEQAADPRRWRLLWILVLGLVSHGGTMTVLAASLSDIADDLGTTSAGLAWAVTGPTLGFALGMPLFGKLADLKGHRRIFLCGVTGVVLCTIGSALAWSAASLVAFRVLAGLAGSAIGPSSIALVVQAFPVGERPRALGWWTFVMTGAPVIGLVGGGPLIEAVGWRAVFVVSLPLAVAGLVLGWRVIRPDPPVVREPLDVAGALALAVGSLGFLLGLDRGASWGFGHPGVLALFALSPIGLTAFVAIERRASHPLLRLDYFARRGFTAPIAVSAAIQYAYMGGFIVTPLLLRDLLGFSLSAATLLLICRPLSYSLTAPLGGWLVGRVGARTAMLTGSVLMASSMAAFVAGASAEVLAPVVVGLVLSGIACGVASPSFATSIVAAADADDVGVATATLQTITQMAIVTGMQVSLLALGDERTGRAFAMTYGAAGAVGLLALGAAFAVPGGRRALVALRGEGVDAVDQAGRDRQRAGARRADLDPLDQLADVARNDQLAHQER